MGLLCVVSSMGIIMTLGPKHRLVHCDFFDASIRALGGSEPRGQCTFVRPRSSGSSR